MEDDRLGMDPMPEPTAIDYFAAIVKLGISAIRDWGGPASELFGLITAPLLGKRRDEWFESLRNKFNTLCQKVDGLTIESLASNEQFISALLQATQAAVKTHHAEKLEALQNAVVNIAIGKELKEDRRNVFLSMIDQFTPTHLRLLRFFQDPGGHGVITLPAPPAQLSVYGVLMDNFPDLNYSVSSSGEEPTAARGQFLGLIIRDLSAARLISISRLFDKVPHYPRWTTHLGDDFLDFITSPEE